MCTAHDNQAAFGGRNALYAHALAKQSEHVQDLNTHLFRRKSSHPVLFGAQSRMSRLLRASLLMIGASRDGSSARSSGFDSSPQTLIDCKRSVSSSTCRRSCRHDNWLMANSPSSKLHFLAKGVWLSSGHSPELGRAMVCCSPCPGGISAGMVSVSHASGWRSVWVSWRRGTRLTGLCPNPC